MNCAIICFLESKPLEEQKEPVPARQEVSTSKASQESLFHLEFRPLGE